MKQTNNTPMKHEQIIRVALSTLTSNRKFIDAWVAYLAAGRYDFSTKNGQYLHDLIRRGYWKLNADEKRSLTWACKFYNI